MKLTEQYFFSIIKSALWGAPVDVPADFTQWNKIMHLAKCQALTGLVCDVLLTRPAIRARLSEKFVEKLQEIPLNNMGMHTQMNITLQLLVQTLSEEGIDSVLLKGQGLSMYYPTPQLRQCGDIDLYVGVENFEKAYDAILPIVTEIDDKAGIWNWMHFDAKIGSVMIEIHQQADYMHSRKKDRLYKKLMSEGLSKDLSPLKIGEVEVNTPNDTFNAFYVFYHLWRHFSTSGVGLRQFCDWACFLHTHVGKLDLPRLKKMLDDFGYMKPWQLFGCFLVTDLGLPENEFPFYNKRYVGKVEKVREYVMADGNFGVNIAAGREKSKGYLHGKWVSFKYHMLRFFRMFRLFPKHTMLRLYYMLRDGIEQVVKDLRKKK